MKTLETYERQNDGSLLLVGTEEITSVETPTIEDQIKTKEEELLKIYQEIQELKTI